MNYSNFAVSVCVVIQLAVRLGIYLTAVAMPDSRLLVGSPRCPRHINKPRRSRSCFSSLLSLHPPSLCTSVSISLSFLLPLRLSLRKKNCVVEIKESLQLPFPHVTKQDSVAYAGCFVSTGALTLVGGGGGGCACHCHQPFHA